MATEVAAVLVALAHRRVVSVRPWGFGELRYEFDCGHAVTRATYDLLEVGVGDEVDCQQCERCPCCQGYGVPEGAPHRPPGG